MRLDLSWGATPFQSITKKGSFTLVTRQNNPIIGKMVKQIFGKFFIGAEHIHDELAWFWLLTLTGGVVLFTGIGIYLLGNQLL